MELNVLNTLSILNHYLQKRSESRTFIICGGASLILQNIVGRSTLDVDIISPEIDKVLKEASEEVANHLGLDKNWLNTAPKGLANDMKPGWESRIIKVFEDTNLLVYSISREDMIFSKFYAYCDRQKDILDLIDLKPTKEEIERSADLTSKLDGNPDWPGYVELQKSKLYKKLGHE